MVKSMGRECSTHGGEDECTQVVHGKTRRRPLDDTDIGRRILKWIIGKQGAVLWSGFIWLRIRTTDGVL
jgi:hypothetical protein